jgi:hypothetical protein
MHAAKHATMLRLVGLNMTAACRRHAVHALCASVSTVQLEEWEAEPSPGQLSLVEAVREVLAALLRELARNNRYATWLR